MIMKKHPFFVQWSAPHSAWRRLWLVGGSCLWFGVLSLPTGAQADSDPSSDNAPSESDQLETPASDWTAQWIGRHNPASVPALGQQAPATWLRRVGLDVGVRAALISRRHTAVGQLADFQGGPSRTGSNDEHI